MRRITLHSEEVFYTIIIISFIIFISMYLASNNSHGSHYCKAESFSNNSQVSNSLIQTRETMDEQIDSLTFSEFKPECCDSIYTTSHGCLCYKDNEYRNIVSRGGNRPMTQTDCTLEARLKKNIQEKEEQERNRQRGIFVFPKHDVFEIMDE